MSGLPRAGERFCCSWSGGKDSCLALHRAAARGARPAMLLTMLAEDGRRTRSHGLRREVIEEQASRLGLELRTAAAAWGSYEAAFVELLREAAGCDIHSAVFGDIDIEDHRRWSEGVCARAGMTAFMPLWRQERKALLREWWKLGYEARIVVVREGILDPRLLWRRLTPDVAEEMEREGIDLCGENGEYHTLATAGPLFPRPLSLEPGRREKHGGCWVQDVELAGASASQSRARVRRHRDEPPLLRQ